MHHSSVLNITPVTSTYTCYANIHSIYSYIVLAFMCVENFSSVLIDVSFTVHSVSRFFGSMPKLPFCLVLIVPIG